MKHTKTTVRRNGFRLRWPTNGELLALVLCLGLVALPDILGRTYQFFMERNDVYNRYVDTGYADITVRPDLSRDCDGRWGWLIRATIIESGKNVLDSRCADAFYPPIHMDIKEFERAKQNQTWSPGDIYHR
jgi:hypothetical protein